MSTVDDSRALGVLAGKHRLRLKCGERWERKHPHPLPPMCSLLKKGRELRRHCDVCICRNFPSFLDNPEAAGVSHEAQGCTGYSSEAAGIRLRANDSPSPVQHPYYLSGPAAAITNQRRRALHLHEQFCTDCQRCASAPTQCISRWTVT